ncbi:AraC family transcriptional regulator [Paenibacillus fonticola]|uniref:AraC family transcriptional regulator n=1 Tax=Paenibacillus fonticola TaxID=379896 RepID=UPI00037C8F24|nr:AraC family transcriptional regulator [Paenibacillus fonticola]
MNGYLFNVDQPLHMTMTGKFVSPSPDWIHLSRVLMDYELFVQTKGVLYIADEKERYVLEEGDFLLMPPRARQHGYRSSDCSFYWLHFIPSDGGADVQAIDMARHEHQAGSIVIPSKGTLRSTDKIIVLMKQLQDAVRNYREQTLSNYMTTTILCELYNQLFRHEISPDRKLKQHQLYNDIVDYIQWHRYEPLKVSQIADHFGYNVKYLSHLFSSIAGVSLKQFILQQKIAAASFLLTDTNQTINEIAIRLNYHDSHHFMKSFKQMTGLTPTEYRNAYANRLLFYK